MGIFDDIRNKLSGKDPQAVNQADPDPDTSVTQGLQFGPLPSIQDASDQTDEERAICIYVKQQIEETRTQSNRIAHEAIWLTNIAYLMGYSVTYNPVTRNFVNSDSTSRTSRRNKVYKNIILPDVQGRLARMLKNPPRYDVLPNSEDTDSEESARLGTQIINMVWDKERINKKRIELGMWMQQCGHSYIKVAWDPTKGDDLTDPISGEIVGKQGDLDISVCSALSVYPDPQAKSFEELRKITEVNVRRLDYFRDHYPDRGEAVKEEGAWLQSIQYEQRINSLAGSGVTASASPEMMKHSAIEMNYYEKPGKKYKNGRHIIVANGVLLKYDELPAGIIPLAKFDDIPIGGKYFSESVITHCRPLQDQYNRVLQRISDWENKCLAGKYIAARGHGISQEGFNDMSGEVVEYDPVPNAPEPHALQMPVISGDTYKQLEGLENGVHEFMGLGDISRGQLPYAGIPAEGIQLILEQDETRLGIEVEQHEHSWAYVGELILKYYQKFAITPRSLRTKESGRMAFKTFTGEDITTFDVTVKRGSTIPNSKVLERQEIINAWQQGLLGNPQDPNVKELVLGMIEFGRSDELWKDVVLDKYQITQSIKMIEEGQQPPINKLDNHAMHIIEKNRYRKSDRFNQLPSPYKKLLIDDILQHANMAAELANPQLATPPVDPSTFPAKEQALQQNAPPGIRPPQFRGAHPPPHAGNHPPIANLPNR